MNKESFTQLVDAHYAALYRFAFSLARGEADACDLVQQTFYVWATKGHMLRDEARAKTWLFTTLYREFLRGRRREWRHLSVEDLPPQERELADEDVDLVRKLDAAGVVEALRQVDEVFRVPLTLFYMEDLSYLEIADVLEVPVGTVMSRLSRGKAQLRAAVARGQTRRDAEVFPFPNPKKRGDAR